MGQKCQERSIVFSIVVFELNTIQIHVSQKTLNAKYRKFWYFLTTRHNTVHPYRNDTSIFRYIEASLVRAEFYSSLRKFAPGNLDKSARFVLIVLGCLNKLVFGRSDELPNIIRKYNFSLHHSFTSYSYKFSSSMYPRKRIRWNAAEDACVVNVEIQITHALITTALANFMTAVITIN